MKLRDIAARIPGATIQGNADAEIREVRYDSRQVGAGDLFCALVGGKVDANRFNYKVLEQGVSAILTAKPEALPEGATGLIVDNDRRGMALAAHALHHKALKKLDIISITGTNGKTTCSILLQHILSHAGAKTGRIGTLGWNFADDDEAGKLTTPEAPDLVRRIAEWAEKGATHVVMEVTSIALEMHRVDGFNFIGGLFTNLSQDHLDLHGDMENYFRAKKLFFEMLDEKSRAVTNAKDPYGLRMVENITAPALGFGFDPFCDIWGMLDEETPAGMRIRVGGVLGEVTVFAPLIGRFNAENVLATTALALALGVPKDAIRAGLENTPQVRGRMERLALEDGVTAVIDYAHTPEALRKALEALRPATRNRLIVVFGAGGDRDATKRPQMGRIAVKLADQTFVTSDNPRTEQPKEIIEDILDGAKGYHVTAITDRREAIRAALDSAGEGDTVLIAGKGHETYQEVDGVRHHFDDREEVLTVSRLAGEAAS